MAIYHLRASMISRSAGRSATGAAAYRSGELIHDARTGLDFDYRARSGVTHVEILAPAHAPDWVHDRAALWNAVERAETRKNSQVAREIRVALPAELDRNERIALVRDFCQRSFVDRGMVADIALHAPGREGDERNHHAHILLTTREIDADGFTTKNRDWNAVAVLEDWREAWAQDSNAALERAGHALRIDHRTLEAQREEALELANNTKYGLAAYIWTNDLKRAHNVAQNVEAGMVWLNSNNVRDLRTPFGGVKASGLGHEGGYRSIDFYTDQQAVHINLGEVHNPVFGKQEQAAAKIDG
mgnify:CR=1 FL=1